ELSVMSRGSTPAPLVRSACRNAFRSSFESESFFFQAEDGIRYYKVTGVQTCALPICSASPETCSPGSDGAGSMRRSGERLAGSKIGRASCRERVEIWVVVGSL